MTKRRTLGGALEYTQWGRFVNILLGQLSSVNRNVRLDGKSCQDYGAIAYTS